MAGKFSGRLSGFVDDGPEMFVPSVEERPKVRTSDLEAIETKRNTREEEKRPKAKKGSFERIFEESQQLIDLYSDESVEAFDRYFTEFAPDDEDYELKQSLIAKGRKYARETKVSKEASEVAKAFSGNEKLIDETIGDITGDIKALQRDIDQIRSLRTGRNTKMLVDMVENKTALYNARMAAIKEKNNMTKTVIELQAKARKEQKEADPSGDSGALINRAIGDIIGSRGAALGTVGGYASVSGAKDVDEGFVEYIEDEGAEYEANEEDDGGYDVNDPNAGRVYLKYEGRGVKLVVTEDDQGRHRVHAEDRDGEVLPDYPLPTNANHLQFSVNEKLGTATDDCNRQYEFRRI